MPSVLRRPRGGPLRLAPALLLVAACSRGVTSPPPPSPTCTFANPVGVGQDPSIVRQGANYYLVQSRDDGIYVYRSPKLSQPFQNPVRVWTPPASGWNRANVWAPELLLIDGRWYIYYAASSTSGAPFVNQRTGVLRSASADPQGAWEDVGQLWTGNGAPNAGGESIWAIDMTVARIGGQLYAVWSGWDANAATDKTPQSLFMAPMSDPVTISGPRVKISAPDAAWERGPELDLQEGPEFLQRNGQTFIVYSTRDSWLPTYALGLLKLKSGAAPLDPASWEKSGGPVFASANGVIGVGHNSFTVSPDSTEDWIVYHAKTSASPGWDRVVRLQKFGWKADGTPDFGAPSSATLNAPAGECR